VNVIDLGSVNTLVLEFLPNVHDVSSLGGVQNLTITKCKNIVNVVDLGSVNTLVLKYMDNVHDVSSLGGVQNLTITACENITDTSALSTVPNLNYTTYSDCDSMTDYSGLG
jgi:hypothetical protein